MKTKRALFLVGDSISIHYWPYFLRFLSTDWDASRKEANGGDSGMVLGYLRELLPGRSAGFVLVNAGLHDVKRYPGSPVRRVEAAKYRENLFGIVEICRQHGSKLVWISSTPVIDPIHNSRTTEFSRHGVDIREYNRIATQVMGSEGVPVIDLYAVTNAIVDTIGAETAFLDHVHFGPQVRAVQAAYLAGWLETGV